MDWLLVCAIVFGAILIMVYRAVRMMRTPTPTCCGCDTCTQPDGVKDRCDSGDAPPAQTGACTKTQPDDS